MAVDTVVKFASLSSAVNAATAAAAQAMAATAIDPDYISYTTSNPPNATVVDTKGAKLTSNNTFEVLNWNGSSWVGTGFALVTTDSLTSAQAKPKPDPDDYVVIANSLGDQTLITEVRDFSYAVARNTNVATIDDLKALVVTDIEDGTRVNTLGYYASGDGGGNSFYWDSAATTAQNNGTSIRPNSIASDATPGRWLALDVDVINVKQFGAKGDGSTDDSTAINAAALFCRTNNKGLLFKRSGLSYVINSQIDLRDITYIYSEQRIISNVSGSASVLIGGNSAVRAVHAHIEVTRNSQNWTAGTVGVKATFLRAGKLKIYVYRHEVGLLLEAPSSQYIIYSDIEIIELGQNKVNLKLHATGTGYIIDNRFNNGALIMTQNSSTIAQAQIYIRTEDSGFVADNLFDANDYSTVGANFDDADVAGIVEFYSDGVSSGTYGNKWRDIRVEYGDTLDLQWVAIRSTPNNRAVKATIEYRKKDDHFFSVKVENSAENNIQIRQVYSADNFTQEQNANTPSIVTPVNDGGSLLFPGRYIYKFGTGFVDSVNDGTDRFAIGDGLAVWDTAQFAVGYLFSKSTEDAACFAINMPRGNFELAVVCWDAFGNLISGTSPYYALSEAMISQSVNGQTAYFGRGGWLYLHKDVSRVFIGYCPWAKSTSRFRDLRIIQTAGNTSFNEIKKQPNQIIVSASPTRFFLPVGSRVFGTSADGWRNTFNLETEMNVAGIGTDTTITVDSAAGVNSGDTIAIELDSTVKGFKKWHYTTVNGAPVGNVITLTNALPSAAAINNRVFVNRWVTA